MIKKNHYLMTGITIILALMCFTLSVAWPQWRAEFPGGAYFPLGSYGYTPYDAPISSVFDHSMDTSYAKNVVVTAYTGEKGDNQKYSGSCDCYSKTDGQQFNINNYQYTGTGSCGGRYYLCYDGHPGVDYPVYYAPVNAADDGTVHMPDNFPGVLNAQNYNTIEIDHHNGYKTYYLHLSSRVVAEGDTVTRGQLIGYSGDVGSSGSYHLHFEVQKNGIPVDPYGWEGTGTDPYTSATNYNLWESSSPDFDHFEITYENGGAIYDKAVGQQFPIKITALNADGTVKTGLNGNIDISAPGRISPSTAWLQNGSSVVNVKLFQSGSNITISASGFGMTGTSNPFNVTGGPAGHGKVTGRVVDSTGTAINGATVIISSVIDGPSVYPDLLTDSNGRFTFSDVSAGVYFIRAEKNGKQNDTCIRIELAPGETRTVEMEIALFDSTAIPVVLVPGMLGSSHKSMAGKWGKSGIYPQFKNPTYEDAADLVLHDPDSKVGWRNLKDSLVSINVHSVYCPWDWRMPLDQAADTYLAKCIDKAKAMSPNGKVNVIAHSMGGLLVRTYIQKRDCADTILNFSMVGTPNLGSTNAYFLWEGGDPKKIDDLFDGIFDSWMNVYWKATEIMYEDTYKKGDIGPSENAKIQQFYQEKVKTARELQPINGFLKHNGAGTPQAIATDGNINTTLQTLNNDGQKNVCMGDESSSSKVVTRVYLSDAEKTLTNLNVYPPSGLLVLSPLYSDGWPKKPTPTALSGDGTVPEVSAQYPCSDGWASCKWTSGEHMKLINTARNLIINDLYPGQASPQRLFAAAAAPATPSIQITYTGLVQPHLVDPQGHVVGLDYSTGDLVNDVPDASVNIDNGIGNITIPAPLEGTYTLSMKSYYSGDFSVRVSYVDESQIATKSFKAFNSSATGLYTIVLNSASEDKITLSNTPLPPTNLQADAVDSGGLKTTLSWTVSSSPDVTGYNIYAKYIDEPYLAQIGTSATNSFDTGDAWAESASVVTSIYAVSAKKADGTESFLSNMVQNDDRDHDGLTDDQETSLGTNVSNPDSDGDGLKDGEEYIRGTNPLLADTDGDGYIDVLEIQANGDPLDTNSVPSIRIAGTSPVYYPSLQSASDAAVAQNVIQMVATNLIGDLNHAKAVSIVLKGGFDTQYNSNLSETTILGTLTISNGTITVDRIVIQ